MTLYQISKRFRKHMLTTLFVFRPSMTLSVGNEDIKVNRVVCLEASGCGLRSRHSSSPIIALTRGRL